MATTYRWMFGLIKRLTLLVPQLVNADIGGHCSGTFLQAVATSDTISAANGKMKGRTIHWCLMQALKNSRSDYSMQALLRKWFISHPEHLPQVLQDEELSAWLELDEAFENLMTTIATKGEEYVLPSFGGHDQLRRRLSW